MAGQGNAEEPDFVEWNLNPENDADTEPVHFSSLVSAGHIEVGKYYFSRGPENDLDTSEMYFVVIKQKIDACTFFCHAAEDPEIEEKLHWSALYKVNDAEVEKKVVAKYQAMRAAESALANKAAEMTASLADKAAEMTAPREEAENTASLEEAGKSAGMTASLGDLDEFEDDLQDNLASLSADEDVESSVHGSVFGTPMKRGASFSPLGPPVKLARLEGSPSERRGRSLSPLGPPTKRARLEASPPHSQSPMGPPPPMKKHTDASAASGSGGVAVLPPTPGQAVKREQRSPVRDAHQGLAIVPKPAPQTKICRTCKIELPLDAFAGKPICIEDDRATESWQRQMRIAWGKDYKRKYTALKKEEGGERLRRILLNHRLSNENRTTRELQPDSEALLHNSSHKKRKLRRGRYEKVTFEGYKAHFEQPKFGGYSEAQIQQMWQEFTRVNKCVDTKGVISGVRGHKRYRLRVGSDSDSESVDEEEDVYQVGKKPKKQQDARDVADFREGKASFCTSGPDDIPDDLKNYEPIAPQPSTGSSAAAPAALVAVAAPEATRAEDGKQPSKQEQSESQQPKQDPPQPQQHPPEKAKSTFANRGTTLARAKSAWLVSFDDLKEKVNEAKAAAQSARALVEVLDDSSHLTSFQDVLNAMMKLVDYVAVPAVRSEHLEKVKSSLDSASVNADGAADKRDAAASSSAAEVEPKGGKPIRWKDYFEKVGELETIEHLKSSLTSLEHSATRPEYTQKNKDMQKTKQVIASCLKAAIGAANELKKQVEKTQTRKTTKAEEKARATAQGSATAASAAAASARKLGEGKGDPRRAQDAAMPAVFTMQGVPAVQKIALKEAKDLEAEFTKLGIHAGNMPPVIVTFPALHQAITQNATFKKNIGTFLADFVMSKEYRSPHGRGNQGFEDMPDVATEFAKLRVPGELVIEPVQLDKLEVPLPAAKQGNAKQKMKEILCATPKTTIWGMAPSKKWIGPETHFWGTIRLQTSGYREVIYVRFLPARQNTVPGANAPQMVFDFLEAAEGSDIDDFRQKLDSKDVVAGTVGPGDAAVVPAGWMCIERTLHSSAAGLKRHFFAAGDTQARDIENTKAQKSTLNQLVLAAVADIAASRE